MYSLYFSFYLLLIIKSVPIGSRQSPWKDIHTESHPTLLFISCLKATLIFFWMFLYPTDRDSTLNMMGVHVWQISHEIHKIPYSSSLSFSVTSQFPGSLLFYSDANKLVSGRSTGFTVYHRSIVFFSHWLSTFFSWEIYTSHIHWVCGGLEQLMSETRLIDERFESVMGEYVI